MIHRHKLTTAIMLAAASLPAQAWAQQQSFNIPAQPLGSALQSFGLQAGQQVSYRAEEVEGYRSRTLVGSYPPRQALEQLIGSEAPLAIAATKSGVFTVRRSRPARPAPTPVAAKAPAVQFVQSQASPPPSASEPPMLEDIVVTAQKREESLQDTPISMVALSSQALEQRGINSLQDLFTGSIPSVRIVPFGGRPSSVSIGMRGLVPLDATQISRDPTVGIYVDGVYLGRVSGLGLEIADVERIEVLRGPQGTLFGRNSMGGAISVVSKRPSGEFGVDLKAGIGNWGSRSAATHINLPEMHGLSLKFDGLIEKRDGLVKNSLAGSRDYGEIDKLGVRVSALWDLTDDLSLLYAFDYSRERPTSNYYYLYGSATAEASRPKFVTLDTQRVRTARVGVPVLQSPQRAHGHSLTAEWNVSDSLLLRSITSWRALDSTTQDQDIGGLTSLVVAPGRRFGRLSYTNVTQHQFSQELQLVGEAGELKYVLGAFYFNERATDTATAYSSGTINADGAGVTLFPALSPDGGANIPDRSSEVFAKSKALFAQATWSPLALEGLHATVGARYTNDRKRGRLTAIAGVDPNLAFPFSSSRLDPMATLAYDISDDINTYVKWSRAYRAGGANSRSRLFTPFDEEELTAWEVGFKAELFNRRARLNVAAYRSVLSDQQVDFGNPAYPSNTETRNAPQVRRIKGVELDLMVAPVRGLTLNANYVYTDARSTPVVNPFTNLVQDVYSYFTPKHAASFGMDYAFPRASFGQLMLHLDGETAGNVIVHNNFSQRTDKAVLFNGRLSLRDIPIMGSDVEFALWGKNLTNATYRLIDQDYTGSGRQRYGIYNDPRTYGIEARVRF